MLNRAYGLTATRVALIFGLVSGCLVTEVEAEAQVLTGGTIAGRVVADKNGRNLGGIKIYAMRTSPSVLTTVAVPTANDGTFQLSPLAAGTYRLCTSGATGFAPPCLFLESADTVAVNWGQVTAGVIVRLKDSSRLVIRVNDGNGHLDRSSAAKLSAVTLLLGDSRGNQHLLSPASKDNGGRSFELDIPTDVPLTLTAKAVGVVVQDDDNLAVPAAGKAYGFQHSTPQAGRAQKTFTFRVTGLQ